MRVHILRSSICPVVPLLMSRQIVPKTEPKKNKKNFQEIFMPPKKTEHTEQVRFITWFRKTYPGVLIFAVPNAGQRANGYRMVAEGLVAGVPDLFIPAWRLWIELKLPGGRVSPAQKQIMAHLSEVGYTCMVCYGFDDACNRANLHFETAVIHKYQNAE